MIDKAIYAEAAGAAAVLVANAVPVGLDDTLGQAAAHLMTRLVGDARSDSVQASVVMVSHSTAARIAEVLQSGPAFIELHGTAARIAGWEMLEQALLAGGLSQIELQTDGVQSTLRDLAVFQQVINSVRAALSGLDSTGELGLFAARAADRAAFTD